MSLKEYVRNLSHDKLCILGIRNDLWSIKKEYVSSREDRAQTITTVMDHLQKEGLDSSTNLKLLELAALASPLRRLSNETKSSGVVCSQV